MAPLGSVNSEVLDASLLLTVVSILAGITLATTVIICGCCGGKKEEDVYGDDGQSIFYSTQPGRSDYCPECAAAARSGERPHDVPTESVTHASKIGAPTIHRYTHKPGPAISLAGQSAAVHTSAPTITSARSAKTAATAKMTMTEGPTTKTAASPSQMSKAANDPNYITLAGAQSDVFGAAKTQGGATTMKSASNQAYQTLAGAQSDVFSKPGGGGGSGGSASGGGSAKGGSPKGGSTKGSAKGSAKGNTKGQDGTGDGSNKAGKSFFPPTVKGKS